MTDSRVLICHWYGWCIFWEIVGSYPIIPPVPLSSQGCAFSRVKSVNLQLVNISGDCGFESRHHPLCHWFWNVVHSALPAMPTSLQTVKRMTLFQPQEEVAMCPASDC